MLNKCRIKGEIHPCGFSCYTSKGGGSVVVDSFLLLLPMFVGFLCLVLAYVMQYLMSFLVFH